MSIPNHAKKVFSGVIFDVYQWEQEIYDGSKATFEMLRRPYTVQTVITDGTFILMGYEQQPNKAACYTLPGGRIEPGEEPLAAAKRELLEEVGYVSDDWELMNENQPNSKMDWTVYTFIARNAKKIQDQTLDPGEKIEVKKLSFEAFLDIAASDEFWGRNFALDLLRMRFLQPDKFAAFKKKLFG